MVLLVCKNLTRAFFFCHSNPFLSFFVPPPSPYLCVCVLVAASLAASAFQKKSFVLPRLQMNQSGISTRGQQRIAAVFFWLGDLKRQQLSPLSRRNLVL